MKHSKNQTPSHHALWDFLASLRLALVILLILAVLSVLGTLVPALSDLYRSFWFRSLVFLLAMNLVVCSLDRLGPTLRRFRSAPGPGRTEPLENVPPGQSVDSNLSAEEAATKIEALLRKKYAPVVRSSSGDSILITGERGRYALFGVYAVHLSVLLIIIGAFVGSIMGFQATVSIAEGESVDVAYLRNTYGEIELGFTVECVAFTIDFWEDGTPKEFRSDLRFHDGSLEQDVSLRVNHPVAFRGIRFYQSDYGRLPGNSADIMIRREGDEGDNIPVRALRGREMALPHGDGYFVVDDIQMDFLRMGMGPAVRISVRADETRDPLSFWVFLRQNRALAMLGDDVQNLPGINPSAFEPYTFFLKDIETRYYTALQANRDPGTPFVWAGFLLMVGGICVALFMSHRRVRVGIRTAEDGSLITVTGRASRNRAGLEREIRELVSTLPGLPGEAKQPR